MDNPYFGHSLIEAAKLIGKDPEIAEVFDLEATVSVASELARLGLALEGE